MTRRAIFCWAALAPVPAVCTFRPTRGPLNCLQLAYGTMSVVKEIEDVGATLAWCPSGRPDKPLLAVGTKEGSGGGFDDYGGELSLHEFDVTDASRGSKVLASVKTKYVPSCTTWRCSAGHYSWCSRQLGRICSPAVTNAWYIRVLNFTGLALLR